MNKSYNYSDFVGMSLESSEDYEPYGYALATYEHEAEMHAKKAPSIESVIFAGAADFYD